jgi:3-oxoacyl-[acyl-carrier protein] reductase
MTLLHDRVAWITGASRGIGRATALEFARHGASLILSARSEQGLAETAERAREVGSPLTQIIPMDVSDSASLKSACQELYRKTKRLDVLVNNAGVLRDGLIGMISEAQLDEVMQTNVYGLVQLMQYCARMMMPRKSGSIVNLASIVGRTGNEGQVAYSASKAAVIGATKSAARELAPHNVRVNAVAPGVIQTDMIANIPPAKMDELQRSIKMGRLGTAEEVARVIVFLASDLSAYVTGQVVGVDGGMWL